MKATMTDQRLFRLEREQVVARPLNAVFAFFADAANLEALTPPFLRFQILTPTPIEMKVGAEIHYALSLFGVPVRWKTRITAWEPGVRFVDEQERGPYAVWIHTHTFEALSERQTRIHDRVDYRERFGPFGRVAHGLFVKRTLDRIFDYRRDVVARLLS